MMDTMECLQYQPGVLACKACADDAASAQRVIPGGLADAESMLDQRLPDTEVRDQCLEPTLAITIVGL